ncbi:MAG: branched-chain amino acid ABC transporter permease [Clostridiales bacterium]|jgi:branched-chain amino acid transport system permease protein|nr:branched-chain amino acid ABC transporter permease [Clostridiales bacterium]OPZ67010.1 MAG: leucine/isoleucine/valine transporter permease subunit [Firmicutes bacterium ADurb.Bin467]
MKGMKNFFREYTVFIVCALLMVVPSITSQYVFYVFERGVQNAFLVIGLVILIGYSGMMTLGSAAHLAIGGYAYGIYCLLGLPPVLSAAIAVATATLLGTLLAFPAFKLSGPFLVVTTVGFGEITRILILNLQSLTGGAYGLSGYPVVSQAMQKYLYYGMVALLLLVILAVRRLGRSRIGLALKAVRQDQVAAEVMGVHIKRAKVAAYALSSLLAGLSGVFLANLTGYLSPDSFTGSESATYLLMTVMGGMSNPTGAAVSSVGITALPEVLRFLYSSRLMVYSLALLIYIRVKWGRKRRVALVKPSAQGAPKPKGGES